MTLKLKKSKFAFNKSALTSPVKTTGFFIISHVIGQMKFDGIEKSFAIIKLSTNN